jgi:hypothetical protein
VFNTRSTERKGWGEGVKEHMMHTLEQTTFTHKGKEKLTKNEEEKIPRTLNTNTSSYVIYGQYAQRNYTKIFTKDGKNSTEMQKCRPTFSSTKMA